VNSTDVTFEWEGWQYGGSGSWFGACPSVRCTMIANGDGAKALWITETGDWQTWRAGDSLKAQFTKWAAYSFDGPLFWYTYRDPAIDALSMTDSAWNPRAAWYAYRDWPK
jgi:hypothetical protein